MMFSILLLALCPGAGLGDAPPTADGAQSVLRTYDLPAYGGQGTRVEGTNLFPASLAMDHDQDMNPVWEFSPDFMYEAAMELLSEEFEYEGRRYSMTDHEQLVVFAPQDVQDRASELLGVFGEASHSSASLRVDVLNLARSADDLPVGVLDSGSVGRLLGMETTGPARSYSIALTTRVPSLVHDTRLITFIGDYDVEVAQSAVSFDPVLVRMQTGVRLRVAASPAQGGCNLTLEYLYGASSDGPVNEEFGASARITTDEGSERVSGPGVLQTMSVDQRTLAINTMIPTGKALVLRTTRGAGSEVGTQLLILRLEGALQPAIRSVRLAGDRVVHLIRRDAMSPEHLYFEGDALAALGNRWLFRSECRHDDYPLRTSAHHEEQDLPMDLIRDAWPDMEILNNDAWIFGYQPEGAEAGDARKLAEWINVLSPSSEMVHVSVTLERGGARDASVLSCDLPLRVGSESAFVLGNEFTTLADYDIEIAQAATISDPGTFINLDGALFAVHPTRLADGRLKLRIRGGAQVLHEIDEVHAEDRSYGPLHLPTYDRLLVDQTLFFDSPEGGTAVVGNGSQELVDGSLRLTVQVH